MDKSPLTLELLSLIERHAQAVKRMETSEYFQNLWEKEQDAIMKKLFSHLLGLFGEELKSILGEFKDTWDIQVRIVQSMVELMKAGKLEDFLAPLDLSNNSNAFDWFWNALTLDASLGALDMKSVSHEEYFKLLAFVAAQR